MKMITANCCKTSDFTFQSLNAFVVARDDE